MHTTRVLLVFTHISFLMKPVSLQCTSNLEFSKSFGKIALGSIVKEATSNCSLTFYSPNFAHSALIIRFQGLQNFKNKIKEFLKFPGGNVINLKSLRRDTCWKFIDSSGTENACTPAVLDSYCSGPIYNTSQWPPTIKVSPLRRQNFNLAMFYILTTCTSECTNETANSWEQPGNLSLNRRLVFVLGAISGFLLLLLLIIACVMCRKLREARMITKLQAQKLEKNKTCEEEIYLEPISARQLPQRRLQHHNNILEAARRDKNQGYEIISPALMQNEG